MFQSGRGLRILKQREELGKEMQGCFTLSEEWTMHAMSENECEKKGVHHTRFPEGGLVSS